MRGIVTYIREGFYKTLRSEDIKTIKDFPEIISSQSNVQEVKEQKQHSWNMKKTRIYNALVNLFMRTEHFRAHYECVWKTSLSAATRRNDTITQKFTFTREGNKFLLHSEHVYEKYRIMNNEHDREFSSFEDFMNHFVVYIGSTDIDKLEHLNKTASFEIL